ncbi:MAG: glycerol-3-phosphate 1-O-acyltransferase [Chlorobi bacterium CHB2]|nr:glycerol-3-phosphate 1-O-acyltransferase [Chlorobi bacterium CHB2]
MDIALIVIISYLLGSIPSAVIVSKLFYGFDIREKGSGNMGSTNTFRVLGWKAGTLVQLMDICKGIVAVLLAVYLFEGRLPFPNATGFQDITIVKTIAGVSAVLGHIWTAFAGFKGGKGVNTALGMLVAIAPIELAVAAGLFVIVVAASGYISLGSIVGAISLPTTMAFRYNVLGVDIQGYHTLIFFCIGLAALLVFAHRSNIKRLVEGRENRFTKLWLFGKHR